MVNIPVDPTAALPSLDRGVDPDQGYCKKMPPGSKIRLTFTSAEVGHGRALDGGTLSGQDGGLAVRLKLQNDGVLPGVSISRFAKMGIERLRSMSCAEVRRS